MKQLVIAIAIAIVLPSIFTSHLLANEAVFPGGDAIDLINWEREQEDIKAQKEKAQAKAKDIAAKKEAKRKERYQAKYPIIERFEEVLKTVQLDAKGQIKKEYGKLVNANTQHQKLKKKLNEISDIKEVLFDKMNEAKDLKVELKKEDEKQELLIRSYNIQIDRTIEAYKENDNPDKLLLSHKFAKNKDKLIIENKKTKKRLQRKSEELQNIEAAVDKVVGKLDELTGQAIESYHQLHGELSKKVVESVNEEYKFRTQDTLDKINLAMQLNINDSQNKSLSAKFLLNDVANLAKELQMKTFKIGVAILAEDVKKSVATSDEFRNKMNQTPVGIYVNSQIAEMMGNMCNVQKQCAAENSVEALERTFSGVAPKLIQQSYMQLNTKHRGIAVKNQLTNGANSEVNLEDTVIVQ